MRRKPTKQPAPKISVGISLPQDLVRWIDTRAKDEKRSRSNYVVTLLEREMKA